MAKIFIVDYVTPSGFGAISGHILRCDACGATWKKSISSDPDFDVLVCPRCFNKSGLRDAVEAWQRFVRGPHDNS